MPIPLILAAIALLVATVYWVIYARGDRAGSIRRCSKCRYDMAQTPGMTCPECGNVAASERKFHFTHRKRRYAFFAAFWMLVALGVALVKPGMFNRLIASLPRPVVARALGVFVPTPPTAAGGDVPTGPATPSLPSGASGASLWSKLAWNQQYALAMRAWSDLVASDDPKVLANLPRIAAALDEMDKWHQAAGMTRWVDAWVQNDVLDVQRQRIESLPGRQVSLTLADGTTIALDRNELFMLVFQPPRNQCEGVGLKGGPYINAPQEYLSAMATTCGPAAQRYALTRLGAEPNGAVDIDALLVKIEASAQAAAAAAPNSPAKAAQNNIATDMRLWRKSFAHMLVPKPAKGSAQDAAQGASEAR